MVNDETTFVDLVWVNAVVGGELEVSVLVGNLKEWREALRFHDADSITDVTIDLNAFDEGYAEVARLDVRVLCLVVEVAGNLTGIGEEALVLIEDRVGVAMHLVEVERGCVVETVTIEVLEWLEKREREDLFVLLAKRAKFF